MNELIDLESMLENRLSVLRPVNPNPEFVSHLRHKLTSRPRIYLERRRSPLIGLVIGLGLFVGVLSIWLVRQIRT